MMRVISLLGAQANVNQNTLAQPTTIVIDMAINVGGADVFQAQAMKLADALFESLPGGTIHALLIELLRRKHSLFTVRDPTPCKLDDESHKVTP
jgi:hypothetical protein